MAALPSAGPVSARSVGHRLGLVAASRTRPACTTQGAARTALRALQTWSFASPRASRPSAVSWQPFKPARSPCPGCSFGRRLYSSDPSRPPPPPPPPPYKPPTSDNDDPLASIILAPPPSALSPPASLPPPQPTSASEPAPGHAPEPEPAPESAPEPAAETKPDGPNARDTATPNPTQDTRPSTRPAWSLPSYAEDRRSAINARFSRFMDDLQGRFVVASQALSDLTGYTAIEQIKARNADLEADLAKAQEELRQVRRAYQAVNERRAATQREVTTLLARKDSWTPLDLERFTALYRQGHELETGAQQATERLKEAETEEARLSAAVTSGILKRYHEEQVWSDRIRRQSTWGTWGLMAVNVLLFIVLQFFAEPWRRRRLMKGIAEAESGVLEDVRQELVAVRAVLASVSAAATALASVHAPSASPSPSPVEAPVEAVEAGAVSTDVPTDVQPANVQPANVTVPSQPPQTQTPPRKRPGAKRNSLSSNVAYVSAVGSSVYEAWPWSWHDMYAFATDPLRWQAWAHDLCSDRAVTVSMHDLTVLSLKSAVAGAAVAGAAVASGFVFFRSS